MMDEVPMYEFTADEQESIAAVMAADARRYRAMHDADSDTLECIMHDRFYYTHSSGRSEPKSAYVDNIRSGKVKYGIARTSDVTTDVYGTTVIMRGRMQLDCYGADGRHVPLDNLFTSAWVKFGESWQLVAWASTQISATAQNRV